MKLKALLLAHNQKKKKKQERTEKSLRFNVSLPLAATKYLRNNFYDLNTTINFRFDKRWIDADLFDFVFSFRFINRIE